MYISFFKKSEVFIFCNMWIFRTILLFYNNFVEQDLVNFSVKNKIVQESKPENEQISTILELLLINVLAPQGEKWYSQSKNFIIKGIRKVFFFLNESHYIFFFISSWLDIYYKKCSMCWDHGNAIYKIIQRTDFSRYLS